MPSMPSHQKVWCGMVLVWFQEIFWVRKYFEPDAADDLRQGRGVAEGVRQPDLLGLHAEVVQEEPLAGDELTGHRLAARHVGVGLHPHAADRHELAGRDLGPDPVEQLRVELLDPGVLLRRRAGEPEVRVGLGELEDVGERPGALADGLPDRPQPGGVDVGVADGDDAVRACVRRPAEHVRQLGPRGAATVPAMSSGSTTSSIRCRACRISPAAAGSPAARASARREWRCRASSSHTSRSSRPSSSCRSS